MYEFKLQQSNGIVYVTMFNEYKKMEAHNKFDNFRQALLWIELMNNDARYSGEEAIEEIIEQKEPSKVKVYTISV